jgi:DNA mismatch repair protein MutL
MSASACRWTVSCQHHRRRDRRRAIASIHGPPVAAEMLEMVGMPLVTGMVSQPRMSRGSRDGIVLAVNGRPISSRPLLYALEECYQGRLERGRHPIAVIDIGLDPELVDVNVHPAKRGTVLRELSWPGGLRTARVAANPIDTSRRRVRRRRSHVRRASAHPASRS